jgi:hypothetical protein
LFGVNLILSFSLLTRTNGMDRMGVDKNGKPRLRDNTCREASRMYLFMYVRIAKPFMSRSSRLFTAHISIKSCLIMLGSVNAGDVFFCDRDRGIEASTLDYTVASYFHDFLAEIGCQVSVYVGMWDIVIDQLRGNP